MNIDETLLSAYLDDELAPPERAAVESAVAADSRLARRLAELGRVRDLVAGMSRPSPEAGAALATSVLAAIADRRAREASRRLAGSWSVVVGLAAAAAVLVGTTLLRHRPADPIQPPRPGGLAQASAIDPTPREDSGLEEPGPTTLVDASAEVQPPPVADGRSPEDREREEVRALLGREGVRRIILVADVIDMGLRDRVDRAVRGVAGGDRGYRRIAVGPGIVVDSSRPNEAEVFVLTLDEDELDGLDRKLRDDLGNAATVLRSDPDPPILSRLAQAGSIQVLPGEPMPRLRPQEGPDPALALRVGGREAEGEASPDDPALNRDLSAPQSYARRHAPEAPPEPAPADRPAPEAHERCVVLVWLTTRDRPGLELP